MRLLALLLAAAACLSTADALAQRTREGQRLPDTPDRPDVIFWNRCSVCHGENGDGRSFARNALDPKPYDFTSPEAPKRLSRAHMIETVKRGAKTQEGKPTAMVAFTSRLNDKQVEAVVDYIIVKFMGGRVLPDKDSHASHAHHGHDHSHVKQVDYPFGLKPNAGKGKQLYGTVCAKCHGANGDGQGASPPQGAKARNFREPDFREFANGFTMFSAISRGNAHMPAWSNVLSNQDIADISEHVLRTFVKPRAPAAKRS